MTQKKAIILLSGGLDSATTLSLAKAAGFAPYALSFRYGQRHAAEIVAAQNVAKAAQVQAHKIIDIDLRTFGHSALTDDTIEVPKDRTDAEMQAEIPITYVPARNTIFLSYALAWAEVLGAFDIFIGVNAVDYSGYPDCRPAFIDAYNAMANLALAKTVDGSTRLTIHAPLIHLSKADIIKTGLALGVDYANTTSCYDPIPEMHACGACDACHLRLGGFKALGVTDPATYAPFFDKTAA